MASKNFKKLVAELLQQADVEINGTRPWDIRVNNEKAYDRILRDGTLGLGEAYMAGYWDCDQIDVALTKIHNAQLGTFVAKNPRMLAQGVWAKMVNLGSRKHAFEVGEQHYDLGNDLFERMLDKRNVYSCAYWLHAKNLDDAQEAKLDLVCRKLGLKKGMRLLDIGGGWGSLSEYAATHYGVSVVMISVSKEQVDFVNKTYKHLPIEARLQDYRDLDEKFDRIASIGMFEHVGIKNYRTYMKIAKKCLKDDGLFLLHTIGSHRTDPSMDPWIHKYIFRNGIIPSLEQIAKAADDIFVVEDLHNFGAYYDLTLMEWYKNFNKAWPQLKDKYGETFFRMWNLYLLTCAAGFRARELQLYQLVLSPHGVKDGYISVR